MTPRENGLPDPALLARCPYLGLHDDPQTSLAYSSKWNYCYRVEPAVPVSLSNQSETCLTAGFTQCPVYRRETGERFPAQLRGERPSRSDATSQEHRRVSPIALVLVFVVLMILALLAITQKVQPLNITPGTGASETFTTAPTLEATATVTPNVEAGWTNPALVVTPRPTYTPTRPSRTPTPTVNLTTSPATPTLRPSRTPTRTLTFTPTRTPTRTPTLRPSRTPTRTLTFTPTRTPTRTASPDPKSSQTPTANRTPSPTFTLPPSARVCGNALDVPFGGDVKFVLHRIQTGESLDAYAETYRTTTAAIFAVNYRLPNPIWKDWIIVIPYGTSSVSGVPPFEPYQAVWAVYTLDELASQLNADSQLMSRYNAFNEPCTMFSGWLLVPREPINP